MNFQTFKEAVIARCGALGIADYELYYQAAEATSVGFFQQEINQFSSHAEGGVCLRCIVDGKMGYASTEELSEPEALRLVDTAADNAAALETAEPEFLGEGGQRYEDFTPTLHPLPSTETLITAGLATQKAIYAADPAVIDGSSTQALCEKSITAIYNSRGLDLSYVNHIAGLVAVAVVSDGAEMANAAEIKLGDFAAIDREALAAKAAAQAKAKLGGEVPETGLYPIVFGPEAMADLLQTFSGIFSAEAARKGLSKLAGAEGTAIAADIVTIVDDPFHPDSPCPQPFDAEGSPTRRKFVVEKGILNTLLYDLKNAHLAGKTTTGNAAKGSYKSPVGIRPFTMTIAPGDLPPEEILAKAQGGIYIDSLTGLHAGADSVSGDFSLQSAGYLIQNGKKANHVKNFTVAGNFFDMLKSITAVGSDTQVPKPLGTTAFGAPTVLVEKLSVAGK
ncbi:MAG: TldD/PmbA family protein [Oscillospiraceae bacterium]|nr:TldD/PmbA family protein [Oscillospiraceae bacterium]